jgi:hypothetical protein
MADEDDFGRLDADRGEPVEIGEKLLPFGGGLKDDQRRGLRRRGTGRCRPRR